MAVVTLMGIFGWRMSHQSAFESVACHAAPSAVVELTVFDGADEASALAVCQAYFRPNAEQAVCFAAGSLEGLSFCRDAGGRVHVLNYRHPCGALGYQAWAP